jgi:hypothetical protein
VTVENRNQLAESVIGWVKQTGSRGLPDATP